MRLSSSRPQCPRRLSKRVAGHFMTASAGGRHRQGQARHQDRWAGRSAVSYGYKTRVFTGAICPLPHETGTVV